MIRKKLLAICLSLSIMVFGTLPVMASGPFTDLVGRDDEAAIIRLYEEGIIKGIGNRTYLPKGGLTNAQAIQVLVNFFDLNLDTIRFIKAPLATDYFLHADNEAWYSEALIIGGVQGLGAASDLRPNEAMTRETFVNLLVNKMEATYDFPKIKLIPQAIRDESLMDPDKSGSVQRALAYGVLSLDGDNGFRPTEAITRGEAAVILVAALDYLKDQSFKSSSQPDLFTRLNTQETKEGVTFYFDLINSGPKDQLLTYSSGQSFDFNVYDAQGNQVYNWSANKSFMMMIREETLKAKEAFHIEEVWDYTDLSGQKLPSGTYKVIFETTFMVGDDNQTLSSQIFLYIK